VVLLLPKFKIIETVPLVFGLIAISLILASLNLQGYQDLYLSILVGTLTSGTGVAIVKFYHLIAASLSAASTPKPGKLIRDSHIESKKDHEPKEKHDKKEGTDLSKP
jgi:hypothetical protein